MMVMTSVSDLPVTDPAGTIGALACAWSGRRDRGRPLALACAGCCWPGRGRWLTCVGGPVTGPVWKSGSRRAPLGSSVGGPVGRSYDPDMTFVQFETRRLGLPHQLVIVGGDDDGGAEPVKLDEQAQQPARHLRIDVAGRLVGEQQLRFVDDGPSDGGALLFSARQYGRKGMHAIAQSNPLQKIGHVLLVVRNALAGDTQRKGNVLPGAEVIEQPEILEDNADPAPELRPPRRRDTTDILPQHVDLPLRRLHGHEQETQQRRLAGSGRARQEMERARTQMEARIPQHMVASLVFDADAV